MRKIVSAFSIIVLLIGALFLPSCSEEVNPLEGFQMPTEADTNSRYLVCEIDGRLFFARQKAPKGTLGPDIPNPSVNSVSGYSPNRENNPTRAWRVSEDFKVNNDIFSEGISFNFWPNLSRDSIFTNMLIPLGKASLGEISMSSVGMFRLVNKDEQHPMSFPYTETSEMERGELRISVIGLFKGSPVYHCTFWFDIKNPITGEIVRVRNGRINHCRHIDFPDMFKDGSNFIAY